jgi:hypothetical protein
VTNAEISETASIDGDTTVEVVAVGNPTPETVTIGGQEVPTEFTSETDGGDTSADVAVDVINAFITSLPSS